MCTGRAPFRGESGMAVLRQVCDAEPEAIRALNTDIPVWLEGIIRKLQAKDPAERFESAGEVAALLEDCLAPVQPPGQPLPAAAAALGRQVSQSAAGSWRQGRKWLAAAAAALLFGVAGLIGFRLGTAPFVAPRADDSLEEIAEPSTVNAPMLAEDEF